EPKKSRKGLIVGIVVLVIVAAVGVVGAVGWLKASQKVTITLKSCGISSDGELIAEGNVKGSDGTGVRVSVEFTDTATNKVVDTGKTSIDLSSGTSGNPWEVKGTAGDEVQQVVCNATASI
ncbi:MAG TPA: hypothetical protein VL068_10450, partial [Microthrixaceae bacterium]|nr:hypothetical protein [Microthrixaceae bacterium]